MAPNLYLVEAQLISGLEDLLREAGQVARNRTYEQEMEQALRLARLDSPIVRWIAGCTARALAAERQDLDQFLLFAGPRCWIRNPGRSYRASAARRLAGDPVTGPVDARPRT
jgi:hypothetical protein